MPIPPLDSDGFLPPGIHDATVDELDEAFVRIRLTARRYTLMVKLRSYLVELNQWNMAEEVLVDGSFVTNKPDPNDIDLLLVLRTQYDFGREVSPYEYNLRSHRMVKKRFGFDLFAATSDSKDYARIVDIFSRVRDRPTRRKGIVRVRL